MRARLLFFTLAVSTCFIEAITDQQAQAQEYRYSPHEKPDPFDPAFATRIQDVTTDPLLKHNLSDMSLAAIFIGRQNGAYALVEVPDGAGNTTRTHNLRVGDKLGPRSGQIIAILRDRIVIREPLESPRDGAFSRFQDTAMMLRDAPDSANGVAQGTELRDVSLDGKAAPKPLEDALTADVLPQEQNAYSPYRPQAPKQIEKYRATTKTGIKTEQFDQNGSPLPTARGSGQEAASGTGIRISPVQPLGNPSPLWGGGNPYENSESEADYGYSSF